MLLELRERHGHPWQVRAWLGYVGEGESSVLRARLVWAEPHLPEQEFLAQEGFVVCGVFSSVDGNYKFCPLGAGRHHQSHPDTIRK